MKEKIITSSVCLILVVGVVIGAVVIHGGNKSEEPQIATHNNAVKSMCQNAMDPKLCENTLGNVNSNDPTEYLTAAVKSSVDTVIKALNMTDKLSVDPGNKDPGVKQSLEICKTMLESAMDSLELSMNLVNENDIEDVENQHADFRTWLASVISYKETCMDSFDDDKEGEKVIKEQLKTDSLDQTEQLTGVALDLVADMSKILGIFNLKIDVKPLASRSLLSIDHQLDAEGLPTWLSASDRKLLGMGKKGKKKGKKIGKAIGGAAAGSAAGAAADAAIAGAGQVGRTVVVAKDGSGQFRTVKEAIDAYPSGLQGRYIIQVKAGVYDEYITVPKNAANILMIGDGATRTIITGSKSFTGGFKTMLSTTFSNTAPGFIAKGIRFENTAGPEGHQAVAFRNIGDMTALFECEFHGYQDTLYVQAMRQFYRDCEISGTVDFIFGTSPTLIQNSRIILRKPGPKQFNTVTADGSTRLNMNTGIVLQNCQIIAEPELEPVKATVKSYLGRPWKDFAVTVIMESVISDVISPEGWTPWVGPNDGNLKTLYYAETGNTGPGANLAGRVKWPGFHPNINGAEAARFTAGQFLSSQQGNTAESWLRPSEVPFYLGFAKS